MRIKFESGGCVPDSEIQRNRQYSQTLGLPYPKPTGRTKLAVVGGAPSAKNHIQRIKEFEDVWIIASAFPWAYANGIHGTYFNIDPSADCVDEVVNVQRAILSSNVHPGVFDALNKRDVSVFDLVTTAERMNHGATTATAVPELAILLDYTEIVFFGCESSFAEQTHLYRNDLETNPVSMDVVCNGQSFQTRPDYLMQAEFLSAMIRQFPQFKEESGGLLRAMVADPDYDITHVSKALFANLKFERPA